MKSFGENEADVSVLGQYITNTYECKHSNTTKRSRNIYTRQQFP